MKSSLTKSLYVGLAVLSLGAVATVSTTANAASKAKVTSSKTLKTAGETRNVEVTGTNALYSKPGTVKGAKVVASKKTMKKLANSKKSADYFRAYYQKVTNKGSVYYKIVSMNGKYRGYIYGGKKEGTFAGGVTSANTTKTANLPADTTVYFTKPGTGNVTWTAPKNTQYKASKQVKNTTPFANDTLTVTKAATKTREGSLYYYVEDAQNPTINGWIYAKAVTATKPAVDTYNEKTDVKVNLKSADGTVIKSTVLSNLTDKDGKASTAKGTDVSASAAKTATNSWGKSVLAGTGYTYTAADSVNKTALASAKTGDTISLIVNKNADAAMKIQFYGLNSDQTKGADKLTAYSKTASATTVVFPTVSAAFTGAEDATYTASDLQTYLTTNNLTTLYTPSYTANGKQVYTKYTFNNAVSGTYSKTANAQAFYTATVVDGASPVDTPTNSVTSANYFA
ncbi:hypothetical protein [Levilactobacillus angrenensis]|uniref:GW domain-containing protein n=1 Tax=Levilactobacillus angrenensis TaxID=2486020 RepID=A0ABW1U9Y8_9LACO|nr:hypothetical protein [Levilactobacillus angrenensis]